MNKPTAWTDERIVRLKFLIDHKFTRGEIAQRMNVSIDACRKAAAKHFRTTLAGEPLSQGERLESRRVIGPYQPEDGAEGLTFRQMQSAGNDLLLALLRRHHPLVERVAA